MPYNVNDFTTVAQSKQAVQRIINSVGNIVQEYIDEQSEIEIPTPQPVSGKTLNEYTWAEISAIAQAGQGANYFDIGDWKEITLNGNVGDYLTLEDYSTLVYILHFNCPENGVADNNIIFGGFKTTDTGVDVAINDSDYLPVNLPDNALCFRMNRKRNTYYDTVFHQNLPTCYNYGGWKGCDLRHGILGATNTASAQYAAAKNTANFGYDATGNEFTSPKANTLLAAFPADLRNVMRYWKRYVDNTGNNSNTDANVTECIDAISLLAEFEVYGVRTYANQYEQNHQVQMQYYANGNSKIKHKHNDSSTSIPWWVCSPCYNGDRSFCDVTGSGSAWGNGADYSFPLAPAFKL